MLICKVQEIVEKVKQCVITNDNISISHFKVNSYFCEALPGHAIHDSYFERRVIKQLVFPGSLSLTLGMQYL
ncbi:hypothetical protein GDO78_009303 [Eleutherodactylus coqui]|uniref:Uncharacterized protein n=1 Tax=Eleutherodactylus coqui TaxID=57060 RepID=A0A8J6F866_ELECQ|nr:hypothetical protein GDO78_009303 [Eleutherodactylus coqui]